MRAGLKFDENYREHVNLTGGERICLRLLRPSDKQSLLKAFSELSASSRRKRFFWDKETLSDAELRYFTEMDGSDHFALTAVQIDDDDLEGDGLCVARFVRLADDPECAVVGITVVDRRQGKGIGRMLLERLVDAAVEREVARFRFECLADNSEIQKLVKKVCRVVETCHDGGVIVVEADLPRVENDISNDTRLAFFNLLDALRMLSIHSFGQQMQLGRATFNKAMQAAMDSVGTLRQQKDLEASEEKSDVPE